MESHWIGSASAMMSLHAVASLRSRQCKLVIIASSPRKDILAIFLNRLCLVARRGNPAAASHMLHIIHYRVGGSRGRARRNNLLIFGLLPVGLVLHALIGGLAARRLAYRLLNHVNLVVVYRAVVSVSEDYRRKEFIVDSALVHIDHNYVIWIPI